MRRSVLFPVLILLLLCTAASADRIVTITFTGDCTIGSTELTRNQPTSLDTKAKEMGYGYFFANFEKMFAEDDATIINFEGVLQDYPSNENKNKTYRFRGPNEFTQILTGASIEAAGLANNHVADYGRLGLQRTQETLAAAGIPTFRITVPYILEKDGIRVAFFALDTSTYPTNGPKVRKIISEMKNSGQADAVVLLYHGGNEYDPKHNANQSLVVRQCIDAGVDLIIMHHPHVVQGIGLYNNRYVCYSLGNFVFGGNCEVREEPYRGGIVVSSLYCLVVRAELHFDDDGKYLGQQLYLYPGFISGDYPHNDYQPRLVTGEDAEIVFEHVQFDTDFQLPGFDEELGCIVLPYAAVGEEMDLATPDPTVRTTRRPSTPKPTQTAAPTHRPATPPPVTPTPGPTAPAPTSEAGNDPDPTSGGNPDPTPGSDPDPTPGGKPDPTPGGNPDPTPGGDPAPSSGGDSGQPSGDPGSSSGNGSDSAPSEGGGDE